MLTRTALTFSLFLILSRAIYAANAPATKPAAVDYSDPRKTVQAFLVAVQSTDAATIKRAIVASPEQEPIANTIIALWVAQAKLRIAAEGKYADQAGPYFGTVNSQIESRLKTLQDAPMKITGESAILSIPGDEATQQSAGSVVLKKIGDGWKIDAGSLFNLANVPKETTDQRVALAKKLVTITDGMTTDINAGKFPSAGEAYQEFWNRSLAASKQGDAGAGAATRPK